MNAKTEPGYAYTQGINKKTTTIIKEKLKWRILMIIV